MTTNNADTSSTENWSGSIRTSVGWVGVAVDVEVGAAVGVAVTVGSGAGEEVAVSVGTGDEEEVDESGDGEGEGDTSSELSPVGVKEFNDPHVTPASTMQPSQT